MAQQTLAQLRERFEASPDDVAAFEAIEEHLFVRGEWAPLVALYEDRLRAPDLGAERGDAARRIRAKVLFRLGQVLEERRLEPEQAIARYREVLTLLPDFRPAMQQLRALFEARADWDALLELAQQEAGLEMPPAERARFASEMGGIFEHRMGDLPSALERYEAALEDVPDHIDALLGAARLHQALGNRAEAISALGRASERLRGPERGKALVAWAELVEEDGNAEAAEELYRRALSDDPRSERALEALAERAAAAEQWDQLDELCERRFSIVRGAVRRLAVAHQAARAQLEQARNPRAARHWLERALELFPRDPVVHLLLADCEGLSGHTEQRERHLRRGAELAGDAAPEELLLECAELAGARGDAAQAVIDLQALVARSGPKPRTVELLDAALQRVGRPGELEPVLIEAAQAQSGDAAANVWLRLASLRDDRGDTTGSFEAVEQAVLASPANRDANDRLEAGLRGLEHFDAVRDHLTRALESAPEGSERACELGLRLGELLSERLGDLEGAQAVYERILAGDPDEMRARQGLERIALASGEPEVVIETFGAELERCRDPERARFLGFELIRVHEESGDPDRALEALARLAEIAPEDRIHLETRARLEEATSNRAGLLATLAQLDEKLDGPDRTALRRRLAGLHDESGDAEAALAAHHRVLEIAPGDVASLRALDSALERAGRARELADVRRRLAAQLEPAEAAAVRTSLAALLEDELGDLPGAITALESAIETGHAPDEAVPRLESLLERNGREEDLCGWLARRRDRLPEDSAERAELDRRRATLLLERLDRPSEAADLFAALLETGADDETEAALERALRGARRHEELLAMLGRRAENESDPERRASLDLERATLLCERGDSDAEAATLLEPIADAGGPFAADADERILSLLERAREYDRLRDRLERSISRSDDDERGLRLRERLAGLCRDVLRDPDAAAEHLEAAAELAPGRVELWQSLQRLHRDADRHDGWLRALEGELATGPERERALWLHGQAAEQAGLIPDAEAATRHFQAILEIEPGNAEALAHVMEALERDGRPEELARLLESLIQPGDDPTPSVEGSDGADSSEQTSLRLRLAALRSGPLDDAAGAVELLAPLAAGERLAVVAEPLADLYGRLEQHGELAELSTLAAGRCGDRDERAMWLRRVASAREALGELEASAEAHGQVLAERPEDPAAREALRRLYRQLGESEPLARLLEVELAAAGGAEEIELRLELAGLLGGGLERPAEALAHLERVLSVAPRHQDALSQALALADEIGRDETWLELCGTVLAQRPDAEERARLLRGRAARLAGSDPAAAIEALRQALACQPDDEGARLALREALAAGGDLDAWLASMEQEVAATRRHDPETAARLCEEAAERAAEARGADATLPWLLRLRGLRREDAAVLGRLADLHREGGRTGDLLRALEAELALSPAPGRRTEIQLERASLLEADAAPAAAAEALQDARRVSPDSEPVLAHLDALLDRLGRDGERCDVIACRVATASGDERRRLRHGLARAERDRGNLRGAAEALWRLVCETPAPGVERSERLGELGAALRDAGDTLAWSRVAEEELRGLSADPVFDERRRLLHRDLARFAERAGGRLEAARTHWSAILDGGLATSDGEGRTLFVEAESALIDVLRRMGDLMALESRLASRLTRRASEDQAADDSDAWLELGRLRLEALHQPAAAADAFREAWRGEPDSLVALRGLRAASERLGRMKDVAETLDGELEARADATASERGALLRRLGWVCWRDLEATPRARAAFQAARDAEPEDLESLRALAGLAEATEDHAGAVDLYAAEVALLGDDEPERRLEIWLRSAELQRDQLDAPAAALDAFAQAERAGSLPLPRRREWADLLDREGSAELFSEVFATWCDDPRSPAEAVDHLRLAQALRRLGLSDAAAERARLATELDARCTEAWDLRAELAERAGQEVDAAAALESAAEALEGEAAAERRARAAAFVESAEPERAFELLFRAGVDDPAHSGVQAALARVAAAVDRHEVALPAAARALEIGEGLPEALRLETALVGARSARSRDLAAEAASLLDAALAIDPEQTEALASQGEVRFELGDLEAARRCLEARLEHDEPDPDRGLHLTLLAETRRTSGDGPSAVDSYREALELDAANETAHAGLVEVLVAGFADGARSGQRGEAVAALCAWAEHASESSERGDRLIRAAELELAEPARPDAAETLLTEAIEWAPERGRGWLLLATLLEDRGRRDDALDVAARAGDAVQDGEGAAALLRVRARGLVARDDLTAAAEAYRQASEIDPSDADAALEAARLLRGLGEWRKAAEVLRAYADQAAEACPSQAAPVLSQLGRLLAGPLEDLSGAVDVYRRALAADPDLEGAREALAGLMVHRSEWWDEAVAAHTELLAQEPTRVASIRALVEIARGRGRTQALEAGLSILRALGAATPVEREAAPDRPPRAPAAELDDELHECARLIAVEAAEEIAEALGAGASRPPAGGSGPVARFRSAESACEAELAAPALVPLPDDQVGSILTLTARIAESSGTVQGDGHLVNALGASLGRRARKRVRKVLGERPAAALERIDPTAWRVALRALAAEQALERELLELRVAFLAWTRDGDSGPAPEPELDITAGVQASPEARALLERLLGDLIRWVES